MNLENNSAMQTQTTTNRDEVDVSATTSFLMQTYGPTLTLDELASVLKRKPGGVRAALSQNIETWAIKLNSEKVNIGRRVLFPAATVAELILKGG